MKKHVIALILLLLFVAVAGCSSTATTSTPTLSSTASTPARTPSPAPSASLSSNPLLNPPLVTKVVLSGSGANIGTCAYIQTSKSAFESITLDQYKEFINERVSTKYNWVSIIFNDGTGILFSGSTPGIGQYGLVDNDGSLKTLYGNITLSTAKYRSATGMEKYKLECSWFK